MICIQKIDFFAFPCFLSIVVCCWLLFVVGHCLLLVVFCRWSLVVVCRWSLFVVGCCLSLVVVCCWHPWLLTSNLKQMFEEEAKWFPAWVLFPTLDVLSCRFRISHFTRFLFVPCTAKGNIKFWRIVETNKKGFLQNEQERDFLKTSAAQNFASNLKKTSITIRKGEFESSKWYIKIHF